MNEESKYASVGRSNIGGWHSRTEFFLRPEPAVASPTSRVALAVSRMVDATVGPGKFSGALSFTAYHAPHSHPDSAWSGAYYVDAGTQNPERPLSGVLEFLDPRSGVDAVTGPGDPYGEPMRIWPQDGLLAIFPSWLYHWVHPYAGQTPRIVVSFNVAVGVAANERRESQAAGDMPVLASRAL